MTSEQAEQVRPAEIDLGSLPVGAALRARREHLGWSLPDVAAWLRIKLSYLEALESGQVGKLPGNAYALGFLRTYAGALGLDVENMTARFRREAKDVNRKPELAFPAPVPERGVPAGAIVLLGVLVVIGAYVGWYEFADHEHAVPHAVPGIPPALAPYTAATAPQTPSPQVASVLPNPGQMPAVPHPSPPASGASGAAALPGVTGTTAAGPASGTAPAAPATASPTPASPGATGAAPAGVASAAPAAAPPASASAEPASQVTGETSTTPVSAPPDQVTLKAVAPTWVQVRQSADGRPLGRVIYDHIMQAGDSWVVPQDAGQVTLTTGNAGGLTLEAGGVSTAVLGRKGAVRRNLPLTVAAIRDGSIAAGSGAAPPASAPASESPAPVSSPAVTPTATPNPGPAPVRTQRHPAALAPVSGSSADDLNARQLQQGPAR